MRGSARIYDVGAAQFVLKIEKLTHIMGPMKLSHITRILRLTVSVPDYEYDSSNRTEW